MENISAYQNGKFLRELEPHEYCLAKRDIAGFYEEQSKWEAFHGDVDFGTALKLPYWDYLDIINVNEADRDFFRTGSLLILAAMALEPYEEFGTYYLVTKERAELFTQSIVAFEPTNRNEGRFKDLIIDLKGLFSRETAQDTIKRFERELQWVYVNWNSYTNK